MKPTCDVCKKEMQCIFNGCILQTDTIKDNRLNKSQITIVHGHGDLWKCECGNYLVNGFKTIIEDKSLLEAIRTKDTDAQEQLKKTSENGETIRIM